MAKGGVSRTSDAFSLINKFRFERQYLVRASITTSLGGVFGTWWERPRAIRDGLNNFRRFLFDPLVGKLGCEYTLQDPFGTRELRMLAVTQSALAGNPELSRNFKLNPSTFGIRVMNLASRQISGEQPTALCSWAP